jgi:hypothetical protein
MLRPFEKTRHEFTYRREGCCYTGRLVLIYQHERIQRRSLSLLKCMLANAGFNYMPPIVANWRAVLPGERIRLALLLVDAIRNHLAGVRIERAGRLHAVAATPQLIGFAAPRLPMRFQRQAKGNRASACNGEDDKNSCAWTLRIGIAGFRPQPRARGTRAVASDPFSLPTSREPVSLRASRPGAPIASEAASCDSLVSLPGTLRGNSDVIRGKDP